jgi:hypothetical protein
MMATMLNHNHALGAMTAPVSVMVSVATHFDTHTPAVMVSVTMHFAPIPVPVVAITPDADAKLFGARYGGSSNRNSCQGCKNVSQLFHKVFLSNWMFGALETGEKAQRSASTCWFYE